MGRALLAAAGVAALVALSLGATSTSAGPAALATYRALTPGQAAHLEMTFAPIGARERGRLSTGPSAAVAAALAQVWSSTMATDTSVRLGDMRSAEDLRIGAPPTPVYLVHFDGLTQYNINGLAPTHELWVCVDARTGRVLWSETYE